MDLEEIEPTIQDLKKKINELSNQLAIAKRPYEQKIMTTGEVASYMKVNRKRIDQWRKAGILPAIQVGSSGRWLYRQSDVDGIWNKYSGCDISDADAIQLTLLMKKNRKKSAIPTKA